MRTFNKTRRVLAGVVAATALTVGVLAATSSAEARYMCNWTAARGYVCYPG